MPHRKSTPTEIPARRIGRSALQPIDGVDEATWIDVIQKMDEVYSQLVSDEVALEDGHALRISAGDEPALALETQGKRPPDRVVVAKSALVASKLALRQEGRLGEFSRGRVVPATVRRIESLCALAPISTPYRT